MTTPPEDLRAKITSELGTAGWALLASHAKSGSLILVDRSLDLIDVAVAIAGNETKQVGPWVERGLLSKLDEREQASMAETDAAFFQFVVVSPFVLAQRLVLDS